MKFVARWIPVVCAALLLPAGTLHAQNYPNRVIRMIVPIAPGGATDTSARLFSQRLSEQMGVSIVVDNRAGAGTVIGTEYVARSAPDGYTLMTVAPEFVINPGLRSLPYDPMKDFTFISQLTSGQYFLSTHPSMPVSSTKQFIALAKARPGQITFGSSGNGSANHLAGMLFQQLTGTKLIHVPYKGAGPAGAALLGGETDFMFSNTASAMPYVKAGRLRAIASTGTKRLALTPDVPTLAESGVPQFVVTGFTIMLAPAGVPRDIIQKLNAEIAKAVQVPAFRTRLAEFGADAVSTSPEEVTTFVRSEIERWARVTKASGARAE